MLLLPDCSNSTISVSSGQEICLGNHILSCFDFQIIIKFFDYLILGESPFSIVSVSQTINIFLGQKNTSWNQDEIKSISWSLWSTITRYPSIAQGIPNYHSIIIPKIGLTQLLALMKKILIYIFDFLILF